MATRAVQTVVEYVAWDTVNNVGKTGDAANHTLRWVKDGTSSAPTNAPAEVDGTNAPGLYKLTLTSTETDALFGTLGGKSSSTGVVIIPVSLGFVRTPTAAVTYGSFVGNANAALGVDGSGRVDIGSVNGDTGAAQKLSNHARTVTLVTVGAGSTTTNVVTTLTGVDNDNFKGLTLKFLTGALAGQGTDITASNGTTGDLTVTALTNAPANGDLAVIA